MVYTVYVLYSPNYDRLYIGQTEDLDKRHFSGEVKSTKHWLPMSLIYTENASTRAEAMKREKQLKSRSGRVWLNGNCLLADPRRGPESPSIKVSDAGLFVVMALLS